MFQNEKVKLPTIFRGDSIPSSMASADKMHRGRTFAEFFITEGLMAKAADGGYSRHLERPLEELVQVHIGYGNITEEKYKAYHSPLISFSTSEDEAFSYVNRSKKGLNKCEIDDATYFIWRLEGHEAQVISHGLYQFVYVSSVKNVEMFSKGLRPEMEVQDLIKAHVIQIVHNNLRNDPKQHSAYIIDSLTYLQNLSSHYTPDQDLLKRALERAKRSSEWLIYPTDTMPSGRGFQSRFQLNDFLFAHKFFKR